MSTPASVELEFADCPLGCPSNDEEILTGRDRLHGLPGDFPVVQCRSCGLMRTNPRPTADTIGFYYPDSYGPYRYTRIVPETSELPYRPLWRRALSGLRGKIVRSNAERIPKASPGRLLEIGCAAGSFLHRMAKEKWTAEGIEFSQTPSKEASRFGYRVRTGRIEDVPDPQEKYDLIVGWMVLEHLHDPVLALRRLRGWTRPSGWLVLSVPNAASFEFSLFRQWWYSLDVPRHLSHFGPRSLNRVLDSAGWRLDRLFYQRDLSDVLASCGYFLRDHRALPRLADWLVSFPERPGRLALALYPIAFVMSLFGQTGRMTVWARPR